MSINFYIQQWTDDNTIRNNMVTPCKKTLGVFFCSLQISIKKRTRCGAVLQATCGIPKPDKISTQLYDELVPESVQEFTNTFLLSAPNFFGGGSLVCELGELFANVPQLVR